VVGSAAPRTSGAAPLSLDDARLAPYDLLREGVMTPIDRMRKDAPFFGVLLAIFIMAIALAIATFWVLARM
jgi:hypothetical protein